MQRVLEKMAKQLNAYDEASLMQLWQHYAMQVNEFEPTKRWEEAAIALSLIQAVHWKNQLFNYHLAATATPAALDDMPPINGFFASRREKDAAAKEKEDERPRATVLRFPPAKEEDGGEPE